MVYLCGYCQCMMNNPPIMKKFSNKIWQYCSVAGSRLASSMRYGYLCDGQMNWCSVYCKLNNNEMKQNTGFILIVPAYEWQSQFAQRFTMLAGSECSGSFPMWLCASLLHEIIVWVSHWCVIWYYSIIMFHQLPYSIMV